MPLIDSRGRLFGRLNLIDAAVVLFALLLVPIGFVTYRVFRVPNPQIAAVSPETLLPGSDMRIRLTGRDFRPYLRITVNRSGEAFALVNGTPDSTEGRLLVETPTLMEAKLPPELAPGTYDLHVFDEGQQVAERLKAFTITGGPVMTVEAVVRFVVSPDLAGLIASGDEDTYAPAGLQLEPHQARAALRAVKAVDDKMAAAELHMSPHLGGFFGLQQQGQVVEAVVAIPAARADTGSWEYKRQPVRAGDALKFETTRYAMYGVIRRVTEK
jgi:hypothetical protein